MAIRILKRMRYGATYVNPGDILSDEAWEVFNPRIREAYLRSRFVEPAPGVDPSGIDPNQGEAEEQPTATKPTVTGPGTRAKPPAGSKPA